MSKPDEFKQALMATGRVANFNTRGRKPAISKEQDALKQAASKARRLASGTDLDAYREAPNNKCTVRDGRFVEPCATLCRQADLPSGKAKGLYVWEFSNLETHHPSRRLFGARTNESPKGLIFNFCPWCGADITEAQPK